MADDFAVDQSLFKQIELGAGLNEGDILRAIQQLDEQIKQEEELKKRQDLTVAGSSSVNPDVRSAFAKSAGVDVVSGDQFKEAAPILQRMSKTANDPKIPDDIREQSLAKDKAAIDQITLRSTTRGGKQGIEVTGAIPSESPIFDRPERGPAKFEGGRGTFLKPEDVPFFPEPPKKEAGSIEDFLRTLEPETTIRGGAAGQREINEIRQRNALRIADFQATKSKQVALGPGQTIFDIKGGKATPIASVPAATKPAKGPTTIEQALLDPNLTPERKKELIGMKRALAGKKWSGTIRTADGTEITFGQGGEEDKLGIGKLTPGAKTQVQKEIREAQGRVQEFQNLAKDPRFKPEENLTYYTSGLAKFGDFLDEAIGPSVSGFFGLQDNIKNWNAFKALTENLFTAWRRSVTGVAFRPEEENALRKAFPSTEDGPTAYKAKLDAVSELNNRIIQRLQTLGPGEKIDVLGELSDINLGGTQGTAVPGGTLTRDAAAKILQAVGGDKEMARKIATSLGYTF